MRIAHSFALILITSCAAAPTPRSEPAADRSTPAPSASTPSSEATEASSTAADPLPSSPIDVPPTAPTVDPAATTIAPPPPLPPSDPKASPAEIKACAARGGVMEPVCMMQTLECVIHYRDAGKKCFDKKDCIGACLYQESGPAPAHPVGACPSAWTDFEVV